MNRLLGWTLVTAALAAASPATAAWEDLRRPGASLGGRWSLVATDGGDWDAELGGVQFRTYGRYLGLEVGGDYRRRDVGPLEVREIPTSVSLMGYLFDAPWSPYALAGGDLVFSNIEGPSGFEDNQRRWGWHVGAGMQLLLNSSWSFDANYRRVFIEEVDGVDFTGVTPVSFDDDSDMVSISLNYHFGSAAGDEDDDVDRVIIRDEDDDLDDDDDDDDVDDDELDEDDVDDELDDDDVIIDDDD